MADNRVEREAPQIEELVRTGTTQDSATSDRWSYCVKASTLAAPPTDMLPGEANLQTAWRQIGGNPDDMK